VASWGATLRSRAAGSQDESRWNAIHKQRAYRVSATEAGEASLAEGVCCRTFSFYQSGGKPPHSKFFVAAIVVSGPLYFCCVFLVPALLRNQI
jgi:hypothetical protein